MARTDCDAAVNNQMRPCHKAARITHEHENGFSNIARLTCPANRLGGTALMGDESRQLIGLFAWHTKGSTKDGRGDQAGADRIDPYVLRRQLGSRDFAEMDYGRLCCGLGNRPPAGFKACDGSGVDDRAATALGQMWHGMLGAVKDRGNENVENRFPVLGLNFFQGAHDPG